MILIIVMSNEALQSSIILIAGKSQVCFVMNILESSVKKHSRVNQNNYRQ